MSAIPGVDTSGWVEQDMGGRYTNERKLQSELVRLFKNVPDPSLFEIRVFAARHAKI
jgi:hypothetical protein